MSGLLAAPEFLDRFFEKSVPEPNTGCFLWLGGTGRGGYGVMRFRGKQQGAHRAAWQLTNGPIPPGLFVLHRCDVPACVNVRHLFLGTHTDNVRDMISKGRDRGASTRHREMVTCEEGHPLTRQPNGRRWCRVCFNASARERARQHRQRVSS